jgi:hypothetical protein
MKPTIENLQDTLKISYEAYEESREKASKTWDLYHNRQYDDRELNVLKLRGQPAETFNIVKLFSRVLLGYYSTVLNTVTVNPKDQTSIPVASLLNDTLTHVYKINSMKSIGSKVKLDGIITGLMAVHVDVKETNEKDEFGRIIKEVELNHVPASEIYLDPMSRKENYEDANFLHRTKWVSEETLEEEFGAKAKKSLDAYDNHLNIDETEFNHKYPSYFQGKYKQFNNYLLVHSVIKDGDKRWEVFWSGDKILHKSEITFKDVKFPYRVEKVQYSEKSEFYGIFNEVIESQHAINQALIKIQLMVNTQKLFYEKNAVEDIDKFKNSFYRVNAVIEVKKLSGVRVENLTREILDQYTIIDKGFERIQKVLGVNDSFLGMAFASDSGKKVKLQQNATIMSLQYFTERLEEFYRLLGWDVVNLIKQFYTATQTIRIADEITGEKWVTINKPIQVWTKRFDAQNQPIMETPLEPVINPENNDVERDEQGNMVVAPIATKNTEIAFSNVDLEITSSAYNDEDEKNQMFMETFLQGVAGQAVLQADPSKFFQILSLNMKTMKTKFSPEISKILDDLAKQLSPEQQQMLQNMNTRGNPQNPNSIKEV